MATTDKCVCILLSHRQLSLVFFPSLPPSPWALFFFRLSVLDHVLIQKMILNLCSYLSCDSVYSSLPLFRGRKWSFLLHRLIPLSNTHFWIVWLNLFMQVQVVGGWTSHRKSQDTQGARFLLLLGSAGSLLPGLFLFQTLLPCSFTAVKREPRLLNLPALSLTALEVTTSTERMSRWCPATRFCHMDSCLFVFTP